MAIRHTQFVIRRIQRIFKCIYNEELNKAMGQALFKSDLILTNALAEAFLVALGGFRALGLMKCDKRIDLLHQVRRHALLETEWESLDELFPHLSRQKFSNLGNELLKAHYHDLYYPTALCLRNEQYQDVCVCWYYETELVEVTDKEVVEALDDRLDSLEVEGALFVVVTSWGGLDGKVDIFQHWEEDLAQDLTPELQGENVNTLLEDLE